MAKKMTLNETWTKCMKMWRWIAKMEKAGDKRMVDGLKEEWCEKHGFAEKLEYDCFFCEYDLRFRNDCSKCPGYLVDPHFDCRNNDGYHYRAQPIAFFNKLCALNRKRLKKVK